MSILLPAIGLTTVVFAQTSDSRKPTGTAVAASVEQAIRSFYDAVAHGDETAALGRLANDGFAYDEGYWPADKVKMGWRAIIKSENARTTYSYEVSDFKLTPISSDAAIANYRLVVNDLEDGKALKLTARVTNVVVRRNGQWQILAEHSSTIPKPIEAVVPGLPNDWQRFTRNGTSDRYSITVDENVKHGGKASASIKFMCGDDQDATGSFGQRFAADEYGGKRVRLSGWLKSVDVGEAALWVIVEGERRLLVFDGMAGRTIRGTTDWKLYSIVVDVPVEAKRIGIGMHVWGKGQAWVDDLSLEVVDKNVPVTNVDVGLSSIDDPALANLPEPSRKRPINLGFEEGVVH
jgi:ketosteroid isomerase-like protein